MTAARKTPAEPSVNLMDTDALAAYLGFTPKTVQNWRSDGGGPPYIKFGNRVRYDRRVVDRWLEKQTVGAS